MIRRRTLNHAVKATALSALFVSCGALENPPLSFTTFVYAAPQSCPALKVSLPQVAFITGKVTSDEILLSSASTPVAYQGSFEERHARDLPDSNHRQFAVSCAGNPALSGQVTIITPARGGANEADAGHIVTIRDDATQPGGLSFSVAGYQ